MPQGVFSNFLLRMPLLLSHLHIAIEHEYYMEVKKRTFKPLFLHKQK